MCIMQITLPEKTFIRAPVVFGRINISLPNICYSFVLGITLLAPEAQGLSYPLTQNSSEVSIDQLTLVSHLAGSHSIQKMKFVFSTYYLSQLNCEAWQRMQEGRLEDFSIHVLVGFHHIHLGFPPFRDTRKALDFLRGPQLLPFYPFQTLIILKDFCLSKWIFLQLQQPQPH